MKKFLEDVKRVYDKQGYCFICTSEALKNEIESCKTATQVKTVLRKNKLKIVKEDGHGKLFSIWIDDETRIYKPYKSKTMKVQKWQKIKLEYSGIPTFFGAGLFERVTE